MPLDYDNISSIIKSEYIPKLEDNIFDSSYLFMLMKSRPDVLTGGRNIHQPLQYAVGRAGWYSEWDLIDVSPKETRTAAIFDWKYGYSNITISRQQELQAAGSDHEVVSLISTEMQNAEDTLIDQCSTALYNDGTDTQSPHGLRHLLNYDRSLGGIDSTTYTWWDSNVAVDINSNYSTTNLTAANLVNPSSDYFILKVWRNVWMNCQHKRQHPDVICCTDGLFNIMEEILQPQSTYNFTKGTQAAADAGFEVMQWRGVPIVYDEYCPDGFAFFVNSKYLNLKLHSQDKFVLGPWKIPVNSQQRIAQVTCSLQFVTGNPRFSARIEHASTVS